MRALSPADFDTAAMQYGIEPAVLKAIADVESAGSGFMRDKRPVILFEGHIFWRRLVARDIDPEKILAATTVDKADSVLYRKWTREHYSGNTRGWDSIDAAAGFDEWDRLLLAQKIDPTIGDKAAFESASYGKFQVMGMHWRSLRYESIHNFVSKMFESEVAHLDACLRFIKENGLIDELQRGDWAGFFRGYNGHDYKVNRYGEKFLAAYARYTERGGES